MRRLQQVFREHAAYARTRREIAAMSWEVAHDLDIDRTRAAEYARRAVYGR